MEKKTTFFRMVRLPHGAEAPSRIAWSQPAVTPPALETLVGSNGDPCYSVLIQPWPELLNASRIRKIIGLSPATLRRLAKTGRIKKYKFGVSAQAPALYSLEEIRNLILTMRLNQGSIIL
jgi:hypothetical protein